jgi:hypothetical protein
MVRQRVLNVARPETFMVCGLYHLHLFMVEFYVIGRFAERKKEAWDSDRGFHYLF